MDGDRRLHIHPDPVALAHAAAARFAALARAAQADHRGFHVALAGGSTPRQLYRALATEFRDRIDWGATHVYFGDERCVPPGHPDSNFGMADEALLSHVALPPAQIHRIEAEDPDPRAAARHYADLLHRHLPRAHGEATGRFDLVLLGLGPDGHIASLFPDTAILDERRAWAAAVHVDKLQAWRISLTYPVLDAARHLALLVAGEGKAEIVRDVLGETGPAARHPAARLRPRGELEWFLDRAAARLLPGV
ncbi:MAG: 6-phosphogluconolactonase [Gammaproteobacteria bacterium]|nr:6-phosphogluconolactonase [Gammaproteobacteria bacterium]